jgi:hypothetical protein
MVRKQTEQEGKDLIKLIREITYRGEMGEKLQMGTESAGRQTVVDCRETYIFFVHNLE